jgi:acyl homoserine lactone synthase
MNHFSCLYRFSGVCTCIGSYSTVPSRILGQILFIRKIECLDRKKWHIESYRDSDYESNEYDDLDAPHIYSHERDLVAGCVRLLPSRKPTLISGALSFMLMAEQIRPNYKHCWEATRFVLFAGHASQYEFSHDGDFSVNDKVCSHIESRYLRRCHRYHDGEIPEAIQPDSKQKKHCTLDTRRKTNFRHPGLHTDKLR